MSEYKIVKAKSVQEAQKVMTKYAKDGWKVISNSYHNPWPDASYYDREDWFFITFERNID